MKSNPEKPITKNKNQSTHWGNIATWYDEYIGQDGSEYHKEIILPGVAKLMKSDQNSLQDKRLVDFACGQGVLCRYFSVQGVKCVGLDLAQDLIEIAKTRPFEGKEPYYIHADVTKLLDQDGHLLFNLVPASYDAVTIVLAIQNIAHLTPVWKAARELLKVGGSLIVVMMHPSFRIPRGSDWSWNEKEHRQERLVWEYLGSKEIEIVTHPGKENIGQVSESTIHFHRPLQAYINTLGNAGLYVDHIEEWCSNKKEQTSAKSEAIMKAKKEIPMFLAIRARKVTG